MSVATRGLAWGGIVVGGLGALLTYAGPAWVPFGLVAALSAGGLVVQTRLDRRRASALPPSVARLAYRGDDSFVAFVWQWRHGEERRMRILRSETHGAHDAHDAEVGEALGGQRCVFDGRDNRFVDRDVAARRTYHYSLFAEEAAGCWSAPVYQPVTMVSQSERAAFEAAEEAPAVREGGHGTAARGAGSGLLVASDMSGTPLGDALDRTGLIAGMATDAVFSLASVFAHDKAADGWVEID
jgi:hypothetical protein